MGMFHVHVHPSDTGGNRRLPEPKPETQPKSPAPARDQGEQQIGTLEAPPNGFVYRCKSSPMAAVS
jgi:hypothetical protein